MHYAGIALGDRLRHRRRSRPQRVPRSRRDHVFAFFEENLHRMRALLLDLIEHLPTESTVATAPQRSVRSRATKRPSDPFSRRDRLDRHRTTPSLETAFPVRTSEGSVDAPFPSGRVRLVRRRSPSPSPPPGSSAATSQPCTAACARRSVRSNRVSWHHDLEIGRRSPHHDLATDIRYRSQVPREAIRDVDCGNRACVIVPVLRNSDLVRRAPRAGRPFRHRRRRTRRHRGRCTCRRSRRVPAAARLGRRRARRVRPDRRSPSTAPATRR